MLYTGFLRSREKYVKNLVIFQPRSLEKIFLACWYGKIKLFSRIDFLTLYRVT